VKNTRHGIPGFFRRTLQKFWHHVGVLLVFYESDDGYFKMHKKHTNLDPVDGCESKHLYPCLNGILIQVFDEISLYTYY
jgi:hypothetical protein